MGLCSTEPKEKTEKNCKENHYPKSLLYNFMFGIHSQRFPRFGSYTNRNLSDEDWHWIMSTWALIGKDKCHTRTLFNPKLIIIWNSRRIINIYFIELVNWFVFFLFSPYALQFAQSKKLKMISFNQCRLQLRSTTFYFIPNFLCWITHRHTIHLYTKYIEIHIIWKFNIISIWVLNV